MLRSATAEVDERPAAPEIRPNPGKQELFLSSSADIAIYGGGRGGGKTWALELEPARHVRVAGFGCVILRRTYPQIREVGGLWETSQKIYPHLQGTPRETDLQWRFPAPATVRFAHLEHETDLDDWLGAQITLLEFDQLEQFTEKMFFTLLASNRSTCGVRPYVRATCNPDPDSWLAWFIAWWIDQETGYPIEERAGKIRWFTRGEDDKIEWADTKLTSAHRSVTFVPALPEDNPALLEKDPDYPDRLKNLSKVQRERWLKGNWKIRADAGVMFSRDNFKTVRAAPADPIARVRYWDKAGTEGGGKYSAGVLMARLRTGRFCVEDVRRGQWSALKREEIIKSTAELDAMLSPQPDVWVEQEPGSGGKESAESTIRNLAGFTIHAERPTGAKTVRASPFSAQVEAGNVDVVVADWTKDYIDEHHNFDERANVGGIVCDQVDASSGGFNKLTVARADGDLGITI